ncbi:hypothetical protein [Pseudomonas aeruginosa]|uniref:hypothetical protein n=1 Tax=Pseudomonas aeruginosa TaxID=287 RepID=UPI0037C22BFF|nr:hypothetical protein [Pseudomonas aeruginosa]
MSEVKRYINCVIGMTGVEMVRATDYAKLAAEAQALREEVARAEQHRNDQADLIVSLRTEVAALRMARDDLKLERDLARQNFCDEQAANYQLQAHLKACLGELSELRARVVVVPDASTVYAALDARERLFTSPENIRVALEAQSRLNGKTVSEGLLRRLLDSDGIDGIFDAQQNYAAHQELRALLSEQA